MNNTWVNVLKYKGKVNYTCIYMHVQYTLYMGWQIYHLFVFNPITDKIN